MAYPKGAPHPKLVGDRTTAMVLARLLEIYEQVYIPFGENTRVDLMVEDDDEFIRVQCKTGRLRNGVVRFRACSSTYHHPNPEARRRLSYRGQADLFGVYCPETGGVYLVPVEECGERGVSLRIDAPLNAQHRKIRWAKDYEIGRSPDAGQAKILLLSPPG